MNALIIDVELQKRLGISAARRAKPVQGDGIMRPCDSLWRGYVQLIESFGPKSEAAAAYLRELGQ